MSQTVTLELELPGDLKQHRLPVAVDRRLQPLLDRQDSGTDPQCDVLSPLFSSRTDEWDQHCSWNKEALV